MSRFFNPQKSYGSQAPAAIPLNDYRNNDDEATPPVTAASASLAQGLDKKAEAPEKKQEPAEEKSEFSLRDLYEEYKKLKQAIKKIIAIVNNQKASDVIIKTALEIARLKAHIKHAKLEFTRNFYTEKLKELCFETSGHMLDASTKNFIEDVIALKIEITRIEKQIGSLSSEQALQMAKEDAKAIEEKITGIINRPDTARIIIIYAKKIAQAKSNSKAFASGRDADAILCAHWAVEFNTHLKAVKVLLGENQPLIILFNQLVEKREEISELQGEINMTSCLIM